MREVVNKLPNCGFVLRSDVNSKPPGTKVQTTGLKKGLGRKPFGFAAPGS